MIKHNFFGLECKIDRELSDFSEIEKALRDKDWQYREINFVSQIHSNKVAVIDDENKIHGRASLPKADAIVTNVKGLAVAVITADCSPIIVKGENVVAVIHAGWRGAKLGVIENAVLEMKKLGAKKMQAFIGPMIAQKSYQVSQEFYDDFLEENNDYARFFVEDLAPQKYLFDLPAFVKGKLRLAGINDVFDENIDTYENYKKFASYRKACHDGKESGGRNISIAMIK